MCHASSFQAYKNARWRRHKRAVVLVGLAGLEPATFRPPDGRATRLRYSPTGGVHNRFAGAGKTQFASSARHRVAQCSKRVRSGLIWRLLLMNSCGFARRCRQQRPRARAGCWGRRLRLHGGRRHALGHRRQRHFGLCSGTGTHSALLDRRGMVRVSIASGSGHRQLSLTSASPFAASAHCPSSITCLTPVRAAVFARL